MRLRTLLLALLAVVALAVPSFAQTQIPVQSPVPATTTIRFEHDGIGTDGYKLQVDATAPVTIATTTITAPVAGMDGTFQTAFPALTLGTHDLVFFAYNADATSPGSEVLRVRVFVKPNPPKNPRLAEFNPATGFWESTVDFKTKGGRSWRTAWIVG